MAAPGRQAGVDGLQNAFVILGIEPVIGLDGRDARAQLTRIAHQGAGLDPERLGRVAGGDRHGGIRQCLHDDNRLPAQGRVFLLLARRKEGVEIEEQSLHRIFCRLATAGYLCVQSSSVRVSSFTAPAVEPRMHAVAVIFDFMQPLVAVGRRVDQLGQLRRNPRRHTGRA